MSNNVRSIKRGMKKQQDKEATLSATIGDFASSRPILVRCLSQPFPVGKGKQSLEFGRLCRDVFKELETSYDPKHAEILKKYGEEQKDAPGSFTIKNENIEPFNSEVTEIALAEVTLLHKKMPELLDIFSLTGQEALVLEWLVG